MNSIAVVAAATLVIGLCIGIVIGSRIRKELMK